MNAPCGCCAGPTVLTPASTTNRPGLSRLAYRAGRYATFLETMRARLSSSDYPELARLTTRELTDPTLALLDSWAIVADILTFYDERIINEAYLRTATERRSILALARLIGYELRPGVASTVYLAYTLEQDATPVQIPVGTRSNSIPGPGEQMQAFETADPLEARLEWNTLQPRLTRPQTTQQIRRNGLYLKGTGLDVREGDPLLIRVGSSPELVWVRRVEVDTANDRTRVWLTATTSKAAMTTLAPAAQGSIASETIAITERYSRVEDFEVSRTAATTGRVLDLLRQVEDVASRDPDALGAFLDDVALPALERERENAEENNYRLLAPWIAHIVEDLRAAREAAGAPGPKAVAAPEAAVATGAANVLENVTKRLTVQPSLTPASAAHLARSAKQAFGATADGAPLLLSNLTPTLREGLYTAWRNVPPRQQPGIEVWALRVRAAPFGHNAPLRLNGYSPGDKPLPIFAEWRIDDPWNLRFGSAPSVEPLDTADPADATPEPQAPGTVFLDNEYEVPAGSFVVIDKPGVAPIITRPAIDGVKRSLAAYGLSGKTTQITLPAGTTWFADSSKEPFTTVRTTKVYARSEQLTLADEPIADDVGGAEVELAKLYDGLQAGRWLIVAGERTDIRDSSGNPIPGVAGAELVMLAGVTQTVEKIDSSTGLPATAGSPSNKTRDLPGDQVHTFVHLANAQRPGTPGGARLGLAYTYKRDTVTIYGNVVRATHGETRQEVLGAGDSSVAMQRFTLKQSPLTFVSAPTVSGVASSLAVRVNDVLWHAVATLAERGPTDRVYVTRANDDAKTTIVFGDGASGARLPTGRENVKAVYRAGIGKPGDVKAGQISLVATRPLGVKAVVNPMRASGGADAEPRDQARDNAPLAVMSLDRLVSTRDYADFARTFAGIGKASAVRLSDGVRQLVHVTVAGVDDIPIDVTSDLFRNLLAALRAYGEPSLPVRVAVRSWLALVISARVRLAPDYSWDLQEPIIRAALLDSFSFQARNLAQDALLADAITVIQGSPGVVYVDVDVFDGVSEAQATSTFTTQSALALGRKDRVAASPAQRDGKRGISSAEIAYMTPDVRDTILLQELKA